MLANYLVLLNGRLADLRNFPGLAEIVLNDATFFWKRNAIEYAKVLINKAPSDYWVEVRIL